MKSIPNGDTAKKNKPSSRLARPTPGALFLCQQKVTFRSFFNGWAGRIRTCECWDQNPVPYRLATAQSARYFSTAASRCRARETPRKTAAPAKERRYSLTMVDPRDRRLTTARSRSNHRHATSASYGACPSCRTNSLYFQTQTLRVNPRRCHPKGFLATTVVPYDLS